MLGVGVTPGLWLGLAAGDTDGVTAGLEVGVVPGRCEVRPALADVVPGRVGLVRVRLAVGDCPWLPLVEWAPACAGAPVPGPVFRLVRATIWRIGPSTTTATTTIATAPTTARAGRAGPAGAEVRAGIRRRGAIEGALPR